MLVKEVFFAFALLGGALAVPINKNEPRYDVQVCINTKINRLFPNFHSSLRNVLHLTPIK